MKAASQREVQQINQERDFRQETSITHSLWGLIYSERDVLKIHYAPLNNRRK